MGFEAYTNHQQKAFSKAITVKSEAPNSRNKCNQLTEFAAIVTNGSDRHLKSVAVLFDVSNKTQQVAAGATLFNEIPVLANSQAVFCVSHHLPHRLGDDLRFGTALVRAAIPF
jgi:hypothetical protein